MYILEGYMSLNNEDTEEETSIEPEQETSMNSERGFEEGSFSITLHAMCGIPTLHTIKLNGTINNKTVQILIDSGSTQSFINTTIARKLGLQVDESRSYEVWVANGEKCNDPDFSIRFNLLKRRFSLKIKI